MWGPFTDALVPGGRAAAGHPRRSRRPHRSCSSCDRGPAGLGVRALPRGRLDRRGAGWTEARDRSPSTSTSRTGSTRSRTAARGTSSPAGRRCRTVDEVQVHLGEVHVGSDDRRPPPTSCPPCAPTAREASPSTPRPTWSETRGARGGQSGLALDPERRGPGRRRGAWRRRRGRWTAHRVLGRELRRGSTRRASRRTAGSAPRASRPPARSANPCASVRHGPDAWHRSSSSSRSLRSIRRASPGPWPARGGTPPRPRRSSSPCTSPSSRAAHGSTAAPPSRPGSSRWCGTWRRVHAGGGGWSRGRPGEFSSAARAGPAPADPLVTEERGARVRRALGDAACPPARGARSGVLSRDDRGAGRGGDGRVDGNGPDALPPWQAPAARAARNGGPAVTPGDDEARLRAALAEAHRQDAGADAAVRGDVGGRPGRPETRRSTPGARAALGHGAGRRGCGVWLVARPAPSAAAWPTLGHAVGRPDRLPPRDSRPDHPADAARAWIPPRTPCGAHRPRPARGSP